MDSVFLEGLSCEARVGVEAWEKLVTQAITIDCVCYLNSCQKAADKNDLTETLNYAQLRQAILDQVNAAHYDLLETLASELIQTAFALCKRVQQVSVTVKKTAIFPDAKAAGVSLNRERKRSFLGRISKS